MALGKDLHAFMALLASSLAPVIVGGVEAPEEVAVPGPSKL